MPSQMKMVASQSRSWRGFAQFNIVPAKTIAKIGTVSAATASLRNARTFQIGVYFPNPNGSTQNTMQGLVSNFGLTWHLDQ